MTALDSDDWIDLNLFEIFFKKAKQLYLDVLLFKTNAFDNELKELTDFNKDYLPLKYLDNMDKLVFSHEDTKKLLVIFLYLPVVNFIKKIFY